MNKRILLILAMCLMLLVGCTPQEAAKNYGGDITIELEPNQKLEEVTWKEDSLWMLTKPMTEDDIPETHTFKQSSSWHMFEGSVTIIEKKE